MRFATRVDGFAGRHAWLLWAATAGRLVLGGAFALAGLLKIAEPAATVRSVRAYDLLPEWLALLVGHALPALELALGVLLLLGVALRLCAAVAAMLMSLFIAGVSSAAARGLRIDCGCFGDGGPTANPQYAQELFRDGALLALAVGLLLVGRSRLAIDPRIPEQPAPTADTGGTRRQRQEQARLHNNYKRGMRLHRRYEVGAVGVLLVAVVVGMIIGRASLPKAESPIPSGATARGGIVLGSANAPHHLVIYEDPQCPVCARFEGTSGGVIDQAVADGRVRVEYRMRSFIGPESVRAVAALGAAVQVGGFAALRVNIFHEQPDEGAGGFTLDDLLSRGRAVGITDPSYEEAVRKQTYAPWARRIDDLASRDGNVGTPDLVLDGHRLSLEEAFNPAALAKAFGERAVKGTP